MNGEDLKLLEGQRKWSAERFPSTLAQGYADFSREAFRGAYHYQAAVALFHSNVSEAGGDVLDVGCGPGFLTINMAKLRPAARYCMFDHSPEMLAVARANAETENLLSITYKQGDAGALDFPDECFDLVTSQFMLKHLPDPAAALREGFRVLRPGGLLYFTDSLTAADEAEQARLAEAAPGAAGSSFIRSALATSMSRETLQRVVRESGLPNSDFRVGALGGFPFPSRQIVEWVKKGFPLRELQAEHLRTPWSVLMSQTWAHVYAYK